jgi:hypothetical protein
LTKPSTGIGFNISHSRGAVALVLVRGSEAGIDIEKVRADIRAEALAARFFSRRENDLLSRLSRSRRTPRHPLGGGPPGYPAAPRCPRWVPGRTSRKRGQTLTVGATSESSQGHKLSHQLRSDSVDLDRSSAKGCLGTYDVRAPAEVSPSLRIAPHDVATIRPSR